MKNIVILISGRGSNMEALIAARDAGTLPVNIAAVISNRPDAAGLETAEKAGITVHYINHKAFPERDVFDAALAECIDGFVRHYAGRLMNIHPSLLPAFPGLHTHRRALDEGVRIHGCSVHFVTPTLDHGPIIIQAAVPVLDSDDEAMLAARVLRQEHRIYPQAVRWFVAGRLRLEGGRVRLAGEALADTALVAPEAA